MWMCTIVLNSHLKFHCSIVVILYAAHARYPNLSIHHIIYIIFPGPGGLPIRVDEHVAPGRKVI